MSIEDLLYDAHDKGLRSEVMEEVDGLSACL